MYTLFSVETFFLAMYWVCVEASYVSGRTRTILGLFQNRPTILFLEETLKQG
jgi:hypothetical protein